MKLANTPSQIPPLDFNGYGITKNADNTGYLVFRQGIQVAGPFNEADLKLWLEVNKDTSKFDMQKVFSVWDECSR